MGPRHPLQRLARLTEFSEELLNDWYSWLPSKDSWVAKFANNSARMEEISNVVNNDVVITMKTNCHMVDQLKENDDQMITMHGIDMIEKIQLLEPNKSLLDTENGLNDTSHNALVNEITNSKSTEWPDGTTNSKPTLLLMLTINLYTFVFYNFQ